MEIIFRRQRRRRGRRRPHTPFKINAARSLTKKKSDVIYVFGPLKICSMIFGRFRTLFGEVTGSFRPSQDRPNQASTEPEKKMSEKKIFGPKARKFFSIPALSNPWGVWGAKPPRKLTNERTNPARTLPHLYFWLSCRRRRRRRSIDNPLSGCGGQPW